MIIFELRKTLTILRIAPQMAYVLNWPLTLPVTLSTCNYKQITPYRFLQSSCKILSSYIMLAKTLEINITCSTL